MACPRGKVTRTVKCACELSGSFLFPLGAPRIAINASDWCYPNEEPDWPIGSVDYAWVHKVTKILIVVDSFTPLEFDRDNDVTFATASMSPSDLGQGKSYSRQLYSQLLDHTSWEFARNEIIQRLQEYKRDLVGGK